MGCCPILTLMVRMKKLAVEEKRLHLTPLLTTKCKEDCPILKEVNKEMAREVNKGVAREVVLYRLDEMPLLVDAFAKNSQDVGEILSVLRKLISN